ncbi:uncharacterized protein [Aegilops tauschii subsp. strangulata]|uniref:uncharacterized protein isoform X3 n=1 Tax=Aegilops tauschii subsp. strangulata TaxID=200361 RepID=UPI001E1CA19D|nr:uncharacterized protein LOC109737666 isoform X2 [Aegilops tauschii subsp. strangulata]
MRTAAAAGRRELGSSSLTWSKRTPAQLGTTKARRIKIWMARLTLGYLFHLPVDCHLSRRRKGWRDMAAATGAGGCQIEVHPVPGLPRPAPPRYRGNSKVKIVMPGLGLGDEGQARFLPMGSGKILNS